MNFFTKKREKTHRTLSPVRFQKDSGNLAWVGRSLAPLHVHNCDVAELNVCLLYTSVFNHESAAIEGFQERNEAYRQAATSAQTFAGAMMPVMGNLSYMNYAITCMVGAILAIRSGDLGGLATFLQYTRQVSQPVSQIAQQEMCIRDRHI